MSGAWQGDWEARILDFVRRAGHPSLWSYLRAHPAVSLVDIAHDIGDAAAVQIERIAVAECVRERAMGALLCDLLARSIHAKLPRGWGSGDEATRRMAFHVFRVPEPYKSLVQAMSKDLLETSVPPDGWLPLSGDDALLREAYERALASLPEERRQTVQRGENGGAAG